MKRLLLFTSCCFLFTGCTYNDKSNEVAQSSTKCESQLLLKEELIKEKDNLITTLQNDLDKLNNEILDNIMDNNGYKELKYTTNNEINTYTSNMFRIKLNLSSSIPTDKIVVAESYITIPKLGVYLKGELDVTTSKKYIGYQPIIEFTILNEEVNDDPGLTYFQTLPNGFTIYKITSPAYDYVLKDDVEFYRSIKIDNLKISINE